MKFNKILKLLLLPQKIDEIENELGKRTYCSYGGYIQFHFEEDKGNWDAKMLYVIPMNSNTQRNQGIYSIDKVIELPSDEPRSLVDAIYQLSDKLKNEN